MKKEKVSFLIYLSYEEQFEMLSDEELGKLMRAILQYEKSGEIPMLDRPLNLAFSFIKTRLDDDRKKYKEKCEKNRKNGMKGGRPKKDNSNDEKANGLCDDDEKQMDSKKADKDDEEDIEEDIEEENDDVVKEKIKKKAKETFGYLSNEDLEECVLYLENMDSDLIMYALGKTKQAQMPCWNYTKRILDSYKIKNIKSLIELLENENIDESFLPKDIPKFKYDFMKDTKSISSFEELYDN